MPSGPKEAHEALEPILVKAAAQVRCFVEVLQQYRCFSCQSTTAAATARSTALSLMPGGPKEAYEALEPILVKAAAQVSRCFVHKHRCHTIVAAACIDRATSDTVLNDFMHHVHCSYVMTGQ